LALSLAIQDEGAYFLRQPFYLVNILLALADLECLLDLPESDGVVRGRFDKMPDYLGLALVVDGFKEIFEVIL
jgi:hypothetical protein